MSIKKVGLLIDDIGESWIAERLARKEKDVIVVCQQEEQLPLIQQDIEKALDRRIAKYAITISEKKVILSRIHYHVDLHALNDADLVVESINGNMVEKKDLFKQLEEMLEETTILATNSITNRVSDIQKDAVFPERIIGLHFIYHAVEIIKGNQTHDQTYETIFDFMEKMNVFICHVKEAPGYAFSRITFTFFNEAVEVLAEGLTTAEELDQMLKSSFEWRLGLLEMADRIGLDEIFQQLQELYEETKNSKYLPSPYLGRLVSEGKIGVRSGEGFFTYRDDGKRLVKVGEGGSR
ncbi:3-hydroxyacyl-CoA dehydrogenase family protein [Paucisalibacillus globulus]|uniref:3-hydroxyacyl-CoA dehydrogenase family protein n=1 Tax=Paucisalibacillus globulus TaxID=351095 RepID=UPI0003F907DC|nr:3-hydroxyacyl-CoA dehydrogenase NAD-binding domain-containing protein [Paucisalibacillus globulus]